ncbi:hypothetical protein BH18THE2_BH18THE2_27690 [soil metagenome]
MTQKDTICEYNGCISQAETTVSAEVGEFDSILLHLCPNHAVEFITPREAVINV